MVAINTKHFTQRLSELIATPSVSCASPEWDMSNRAVIDLLANWLSDLGFTTQLTQVDEHGTKWNLLACIGSGPGGLVLAGHTDTVPCNPENWQQDPFSLTEKDNRLYGLGATDMKGFFPVILAAVESLKDDLGKLKHPIYVLATADEESSMSGARALSSASFPQARYAVIGEPTNMQPIRMHKGIMMESVRIQGLAGHSSNPALGNNALDTMHSVLGELKRFRGELKEKFQNDGFEINYPTLNLGCIHGGDNPNRICNACELHFDLRPLPGMRIDDLHQELQSRIKPLGEPDGTKIEIDHLFPGVAPFEEPITSELVHLAETLSGYESASVAFATEAPFLQQMGMQTIVMGPGSINQAHQPNEFLALDQIEPSVNIISGLIMALCIRGNPGSIKLERR